MNTAAQKASGAVGTSTGRRVRTGDALLLALRSGPLILLLLLLVAASLLSPYFFTTRNLTNVGVQAAPIAILAIGQFFIILTKGIDLSVGAVAALSSVVGALMFNHFVDSGPLVIPATIAVGTAIGALNGIVFVYFRIPHSFIVTLGTLNVAAGTALLLSGGSAVPGVPASVDWIRSTRILGIPLAIVVALACAAFFVVVSRKMQLGRWIYAVGGNQEAARRTGMPVQKILVTCYMISGFCAGVAGVLFMARAGGGDPNAGNLAELQAIAAVIIGGVSFFGGRGHVATVLLGATVLAVIANLLNLLGVNGFWQFIATGIVLVVATIADVYRTKAEDRVRLKAGDH